MSIRSFKRAHARRLARERRRIADAKRRGALVVGAALGTSALLVSNAEAANFPVTNADPSGLGSLSAAVTAANASVDPTNTITFDPSVTGTITPGSPLTISAAHGLAINGPGAGVLAVSGGSANQVFDITASSPSSSSRTQISISGLTIEHGSTLAGAPGGAIENKTSGSNAAALTLTNDTISGSTTADSNGGGGIYSVGPLTITGSTITGNTAPNGQGGGLKARSSGTLKYDVTITDSTITGNTAITGGGIIGGTGSGPFGGAIMTISGSHITGNHATSGSSSSGSGGGIYSIGGSLEVQGSTVSGNTSTNAGGGITSITKYGTGLTNSTISGNTSARGGGLEIIGYSGYTNNFAKYNPVHVLNTTISGNHAAKGAGVDIGAALPGTPVKIEASTISGNQGGAGSFGGGLLVEKYVYSPVNVVDSTISGNTAAHGGGVSLSYGGTSKLFGQGRNSQGSVAFDNSTIASNAATASGGGVYLGQYTSGGSPVEKSGTATIASTIVAGNTAAGAAQDLARPATSTTGGFNGAFSLIQQPGSAPILSNHAVIEGVSPQLGSLGNHGGTTATMVPSGSSPVIDQGHAPGWLNSDQRGAPRTINVPGMIEPAGGDGTDIGAVELPASSVVVPNAGLSASIHGTLLGGPKTPLLVGSSTPVKCAVRIGTLSSCVIEVRSGKGKLLADGEVTTAGSATTLPIKMMLTAAGSAALAHDALGLSARATVVASTSRSGSQTITGNVHLLGGPSITLPLAKRSSKLPKQVRNELGQVAKLLSGAKSITCTAYSDKGKGDVSLTKSEAKAACTLLVKDGFKGKVKSVGKGHAHPVAPNGSTKSPVNRRLVITFSL